MLKIINPLFPDSGNLSNASYLSFRAQHIDIYNEKILKTLYATKITFKK